MRSSLKVVEFTVSPSFGGDSRPGTIIYNNEFHADGSESTTPLVVIDVRGGTVVTAEPASRWRLAREWIRNRIRRAWWAIRSALQ